MFAKIKEILGLVKFQANSRLKDGTEIVVEGDLTEGVSVYVITDEGNIPLPDGSYELEDGKVIEVMDGKITSIGEVEDEPVEEEVVEAEVTDEATEPEAEEVNLEEKIASLDERISKLEEKLTDVEASAEQTKQENNELKEKNAELSKDKDALAEKVSDFEAKLSKMDGAEPIKKNKTDKPYIKLSDNVEKRIRAIQLHKNV